MNEKTKILIKYFVEGKSKRQISRKSASLRNAVKKYIKERISDSYKRRNSL